MRIPPSAASRAIRKPKSSASRTASCVTPTCRAPCSRRLWDTIDDGREVFAYVKNRAKTGAYYWVFAHVTPSFGRDGKMIGITPIAACRRTAVDTSSLRSTPILARKPDKNGKHALAAGLDCLTTTLDGKGISHDEFVLTI